MQGSLRRAWRRQPLVAGCSVDAYAPAAPSQRGALFLESPAEVGLFVELRVGNVDGDVVAMPPLRSHRLVAEISSGDASMRVLLLFSATNGRYTLLRPECGEEGGKAPKGAVATAPPGGSGSLLQQVAPQAHKWHGHAAGGWCDELHEDLWRVFAVGAVLSSNGGNLA